MFVLDYSYSGNFSCERCAESPLPFYTLWFCISDRILEINDGVLGVIPQSHIKHTGFYFPRRNKELPTSFKWKNREKWIAPYSLKPGDVIIFNSKTIHGSTENKRNSFRTRYFFSESLIFLFVCKINSIDIRFKVI